MKCDAARRWISMEAGWPLGPLARRHVEHCGACQEWFQAVAATEVLLETVPGHEAPAFLIDRMVEAATMGVPDSADSRGRDGIAFNTGRLTMKRVVFLVAGFALAGWLAFFALTTGNGGLVEADLRQALAGVKVIHIIGAEKALQGEAGSPGSVLPLADHKNKWLRAEPFAMYEENTFVNLPENAKTRTAIMAGNRDHTYWYFPNQKRYGKYKPMPVGFMDDILGVVKPSDGKTVNIASSGKEVIDGKEYDLYRLKDDTFTEELAVDPKTKLTHRYREFMPEPDGKLKEIANLRFFYDETPPDGIFDWQPPKDAKLIVRKGNPKPTRKH